MKITIKVTKEILEKSKMCSNGDEVGENCAIALAVRDIFPNAFVGGTWISPAGTSGFSAPISLPVEAQRFIWWFDMLGKDKENGHRLRPQMTPIQFDVDIPESIVDSIGIEEITEIINKSETLELCK